jgi:hypothetical protein
MFVGEFDGLYRVRRPQGRGACSRRPRRGSPGHRAHRPAWWGQPVRDRREAVPSATALGKTSARGKFVGSVRQSKTGSVPYTDRGERVRIPTSDRTGLADPPGASWFRRAESLPERTGAGALESSAANRYGLSEPPSEIICWARPTVTERQRLRAPVRASSDIDSGQELAHGRARTDLSC